MTISPTCKPSSSDDSSLASSPAKKASSLAEAGLESFDVIELDRSAIKNASYNPRTLSVVARKKLQTGLKRHGLVAPITWNKRTGNIVGGHQRMSIMDSLMRTQDYKLRVSMIDVPESREKELNLLLNNGSAQGDWDVGALGSMLSDKDLNLDGTGFDAADVYQLFGTAALEDRPEDTAKMAEQLASIASIYDKARDNGKEMRGSEFYIVVTFRNDDQCATFIERAGLQNSRYHNGEVIAAAMGIDLTADDAEQVEDADPTGD